MSRTVPVLTPGLGAKMDSQQEQKQRLLIDVPLQDKQLSYLCNLSSQTINRERHLVKLEVSRHIQVDISFPTMAGW